MLNLKKVIAVGAALGRFKVFVNGYHWPVFVAPCSWMATWFTCIFCGKARYCRIDDDKAGVTLDEWARSH